VASLIIFCQPKKKSQGGYVKHCYIKLTGEPPGKQTNMVGNGEKQLNSVLMLRLMAFFCCSNEIFFAGNAGKKHGVLLKQ
jgi:hypothetical protein